MKRKNLKDKFIYSEEIIHRAKILNLVIKKKITQSQAVKELKLRSTRQIRNLLENYIRGSYFLSSLIQSYRKVLKVKLLFSFTKLDTRFRR